MPVGVGDLSLLDAVLGEICIGPDCGAVAVEFGPVALDVGQLSVKMQLMITLTYVPSWSAIVALSNIVETLSVTAHEQDLIHSVEIRTSVQRIDDLSESLPLCSIAGARVRVRLVYEAEVDGSLYRSVRYVLLQPRESYTRSQSRKQQYPAHPAGSSQLQCCT